MHTFVEIPASTRQQIRDLLIESGDPREAECIRDVALVAAGARPSAYVWEVSPRLADLIAELEMIGLYVVRWHDPMVGDYAAIAHDLLNAEAVAELAQRETRGPLSVADETDLGELLGYPPASVNAYVRARGGDDDRLLAEAAWTEDERRFLLCLHGASEQEAAAGRTWANELLAVFRATYGEDALGSLPMAPTRPHKQPAPPDRI